MQPVADLGVLDLAQPAVDVQQEVVEFGVVRALVQAQVVVEPGGLDQRPDLGADGGQLGRVHRRDLRVLVHQLLQARDVAVALGARHGRHQVADQGGVGAALGLRALAGVVDQERVDERDVADRRVRAAGGGHPRGLAGQPLQVAVLADVHDGVRAELLPEPVVGRQVMVAGRQVGVVIDRDRVRAEPPRRLHQHHDVARPQRGQHDLPVRIPAAVGEQLARRLAPVPGDRAPQLRVQGGEPRPVARRADPDLAAVELLLRQPVLVLPPGGDDRVDERVAVPVGHAGKLVAAHVVAGVPHRGEQPDDRGRGVEADRVADAGMLGRVRREHERDTPVPRRDMPQNRVLHRDAGHPRGALGIGDVAGEAVRAGLLERERDGDQAAVEFGDRDLGGGVQGGQPLITAGPLGA